MSTLRFWFYGMGITLAVFAAGAALIFALPTISLSQQNTPGDADWGHVRAADGQLAFILGPADDNRSRYELPFGRLVFASARVFVADDDKGTNAIEVPCEVEGEGLILHCQGHGVNAQVNVGKAVPSWAEMPGGESAQQWIRVANLAPRPRVVFLTYPPL